MTKMLMLVYNDLNRDARVQRSYKSLREKYDITVVSVGNQETEFYSKNNIVIMNAGKTSISNYLSYVKAVIRISKSEQFDLVYGHDFYSALPMFMMKLKRKTFKLIYDAHELYFPNSQEIFSMRDYFFYFFEKKIIKKSDLVICAQEKRSEIMKKHYELKEYPLVVENISILSDRESDKTRQILSDNKYFFSTKATCIVYAGVVTKSRRIDKLIDAVNELGEGYKLLIVGEGDYYGALLEKIEKLNNKNIIAIGSMAYNELGSLLKKGDIGYLYYPNEGLNNKYCAPNKIYEYVSVGLPIICNENITLKNIVEDKQIGVSSDDIKKAIKLVVQNHEIFKKNTIEFNNSIVKSSDEKDVISYINEVLTR